LQAQPSAAVSARLSCPTSSRSSASGTAAPLPAGPLLPEGGSKTAARPLVRQSLDAQRPGTVKASYSQLVSFLSRARGSSLSGMLRTSSAHPTAGPKSYSMVQTCAGLVAAVSFHQRGRH
jgi:hypothetical protein